MFQRGFARSIPAPAFVSFNSGIAGDVDHTGTWLQFALHGLDERQGSDDVGAIDMLQYIQRII